MSKSKRLATWGVLLAVLGGAIAFLAVAGKRGQAGAEDTIEVAVVDPGGASAPWAQVFVVDEDAAGAAKWDDHTGILTLPRAGTPHTIRVAAPGYRLENAEVEGNQTIVMRPGLPVHFEVGGEISAPKAPIHILLRIRPWTDHAPEDDPEAAAKLATVCSVMRFIQEAESVSLPGPPTDTWGFAATIADATNGIRFPEPGRYVVQWGLFHADQRTWFTHDEGLAHVIDVEDLEGGQGFSISIEADALRLTREGLDKAVRDLKRIDAERAATAVEAPTDR